MNIYLIGMPAVGKSTIGKKLAQNLNYKYIDTDILIEETYNKSIKELYTSEEEFSDIESNVIKSIRGVTNSVISLGGGSVLRKQNIENLYGVIIYLYMDLESIKQRHVVTKRKILQDVSIEELFNSRKDIYNTTADYIIEHSNVHDTLNKISKVLTQPKKKVLVINGPNMNMLGKRDANHYGSLTLDNINNMIKSYDIFNYTFYQSNVEGEIINKIHELDNYDYLIINPAAYTHTSVAIHDALEMFNNPKVEVHLSDVDNREDYRKVNLIKDVVDKKIQNNKEFSYLDAINYLKKINM